MVDPIDLINDHPEMTESTRNLILLICILSLVIMAVYGIVKSSRDCKIEEEVEKNMQDLRKQWSQEEPSNDS